MKQLPIWKRLLALMTALAMLLACVPGNLVSHASTETEIPDNVSRVVYVVGEDATAPEGATTYAMLEDAMIALSEADSAADAVIVVLGIVTSSVSFNLDGAENHTGTYYITGKYGDYSGGEIQFAKKSGTNYNFGGPVVIENIKLNQTKDKVLNFHSSTSLTIGSGVTTAGYTEKMSIIGGSYDKDVENTVIRVSSGDWAAVRAGNNVKNIAGTATVTVGGTANVTAVAASGNAAVNVANAVINMNGGTVGSVYATGTNSSASTGNATINLNAGTVTDGVLVCDGGKITGDLTVTLSSDVVQGDTFTMDLTGLTIEGKSTLNLGTISALPSYASQFDTVNSSLTEEDTSVVVYVDGTVSASGDGKSASTAYATLEEAYAYIAENAPEKGGTIVICGNLTVSSDVDLEGNYAISGTVELTSKYGEEDYVSTATVTFAAKVYFYPTASTYIHDITCYSEGVTYFYTGENMVLGENINATASAAKNGLKLFCTKKSSASTDEIKVTVNGGTYHSIFMGGNTGSASGNIDLTMNGGTVTTYFVVGPNSTASKPSTSGDLTFTMNGGTIATICNTPNTNGTTGDAVIDLVDGTLSTAMTIYGTDHTMDSVTVNLYSTFDSVTATFGDWSGSTVTNGTTLNVLGYSDEVSLAGYDVVNIKNSAQATYSGTLSDQSITVESGSVLVLTYADYTGPDKLPEGVAITASEGGTVTDASCGKVYYAEMKYPEVVYVNGSAEKSGDGLTAETAVKTLTEGYALLDPVKGGTVVVCGETSVTVNIDLEGYGITGQVELTSVYDGVDYAFTNNASLIFPGKVYIYFGDDTYIHDITLTTGSGTVYVCCGLNMVLGENITCNQNKTLKLFCCDSTPAASAEEARDFSLTINSGDYESIWMGGLTANAYVGDVDVTVNEGATLRLLVIGGNKGYTGDLTATINGGTIQKVCNTPAAAEAGVGNIVINLFGGSIKSMVGYNSNVHYGLSATVNVDVKAAKNVPASLGYWDVLYLPGTTTRIPLTLNYLNYDGTAVASNGYDVVNLFGSESVPEGFVSAYESGKSVLCIHDYEGITGIDLNSFDKMVVTGDSDVTCAGEVPTSLVLSATDSILRIRPSQNPGVVLADYAIVNNDIVIMEEPAYTERDVMFSIDFENEYALTFGDGVTVNATSNGYTTSFARGGFAAGYDGNTSLYIVNEFGQAAQNYISFDLSGSRYDITKEDYTVTFWYKTENGGNDQWARSRHSTTAGSDVDMTAYNMGGVIFSNQDTCLDTDGMSFLQLTHYKYVAAGLTGKDGTHRDTDGVWQAQDDSWHYVAVTYDRGGSYGVYVDGELTAISDISVYADEALGTNKLVFGADALGQFGLGNAYIDDIVVYSGALDIIDVQAQYYADCVDALAYEIETRMAELGSEYDPYKADMTVALEDILAQAEYLDAADYATLITLYNTLVSAYESFMEAPEEDALLTMLLSSDIHLGASGTSENLSLVLSQLKELGIDIDVLLSAGDFADNPTDATVNDAYEYMYGLLETYEMTDTLFVNTLGNHDAYYKAEDANYQTAIPLYWQYMMQHMDEMIEDGTVTLDHASYYVDDNNIVQSCSYAVTFQGYHFLVINTDYLTQTGNSALVLDENGNYSIEGNEIDPIRHTLHISDESFAWMEAVLDTWAEDGKPVFAVSHYPFESTVPLSFDSEIIVNSNTVGKQDQQLRELLASYDDVFYFCGHVHSTFGVIDPYEVVVDGIGSFWEINLSSMKASSRGYLRIPSTWVMYVYEDEVVMRARDFAAGEWLTQFDEVIKLTCNHGSEEVKQIDGVDATCTEDGNIEYWHCDNCGIYFSDVDCTVEIAKEDTVIAAIGHALTKVAAVAATETENGNIEYYVCKNCGKYYEDAEGTKEITLADTVIPATGKDETSDTGKGETPDTGKDETPDGGKDENLDTGKDEVPDTGDNTLLFPMILIMVTSAGTVLILSGKKKWQNN